MKEQAYIYIARVNKNVCGKIKQGILPTLLRFSTHKVIHAATLTHRDELFNVKIIETYKD